MSNYETMPGDLDAIKVQAASNGVRIAHVETVQAAMLESLRINNELTADIKDLLTAARVGFKVLGGLGTAAKWVGAMAAAGMAIWVALYALTHGGATPK